ncbi:MAG: hypothetical protein JWO67_1147 [Streptosporangiaceae bacterium]|jgi:hypothetical protein|nr:hypothetical protein [Streptosporangiaceae bacterium]
MAKHGEHTISESVAINAPRDHRREHLERLAEAIEATTSLHPRMVAAHSSGIGATSLYVVNPAARHLSENVGCDLLDGEWWFTWALSTKGTLGPACDVDGAVRIIDRVLAARM